MPLPHLSRLVFYLNHNLNKIPFSKGLKSLGYYSRAIVNGNAISFHAKILATHLHKNHW